jgi:predicted transposase YdaD
MAEESLHQPHDKLVKATFSDLQNARAFFEGHLEPELVRHIDWASLRLESGSFVDAELSASASDLLYSVGISGQRTYLYILFEHQSGDDPWMALRVLAYMVRIWRGHVQKPDAGEKLPPILPLVLAQDTKPWKSPTRFGELVVAPEGLAERMREHTPDFAFGLIELFRMPFEKILGTPAGILTLRALKAERESMLLDDSVWDEALLVQLPAEALECLLRYIFDREIDKPQFRRKLKEITDPKLNKNVMSLADQLRQEGREEGREAGMILTKQQAVIEALEVRFERVPEGLKDAITEVTDLVKLTALLRAAIRCVDLESFAREL